MQQIANKNSMSFRILKVKPFTFLATSKIRYLMSHFVNILKNL